MINIEEQDFRSWLDKYFDLFPKKSLITISFITCFAIYILGLIIAIIGRFTWLYVKTYQTYLLIFGIIWVASWLRWGHLEIFRIIRNYPFPSEDLENEDLKSSLKVKLKLIHNQRLILIFSFLLTSSFYLAIIVFWFWKVKFFGPKFYIPPFISKEWFYGRSIIFKVFDLLVLATPVGFLIGTSGVQIVAYNWSFLSFLSRHLDNSPVFVLPQRLKPITKFSLKIAYTWFVGVAISAVIVYNALTPLSWLYIIFFIMIGLISFFFPQILFHYALEEKKTKTLKELGYKCENLYREVIWANNTNEAQVVQHLSNLSFIYKAIKDSPTWLLDFSSFSRLMTSSTAPIVAVFIKILVTRP